MSILTSKKSSTFVPRAKCSTKNKRTMNNSTHWVYLLLLSFSLFSTQLDAQSQKQEVCFNFNDLADKTKFGINANQKPGTPIFKKDGVVGYLQEFYPSNSTKEFGFITVEEKQSLFNGQFEEAEGKVLFVSNINLKWIFTSMPKGKVKRVCLNFIDGGGSENFSINGEAVKILSDWGSLNEKEVAKGVKAAVSIKENSDLLQGTICFEGDIDSISFGGQEFGIDNVCVEYEKDDDPIACIRDLNVLTRPCTPNGIFYLTAPFKTDTKTDTAATYYVQVDNQKFGPFKYKNIFPAIGPVQTNASGKYFLTIRDSKDTSCFKTEDFEFNCNTTSACELKELEAEVSYCPADSFAILKVKLSKVSPVDAKVILTINGVVLGEFAAKEFPFSLKVPKRLILLSTAAGLVLQACVSTPQGRCCLSATPKISMDNSCSKDSAYCGIKEFVATPLDCNNDGTFKMAYKFSGDNKSLSGYYIYVNSQRFGPFRYAINGGTVGPIKPNADGFYRVVMADVENLACVDTVEIKKFFCQPCTIRDLSAAYIICEQEKQDIFILNLLSGPTVDTSFSLAINGINIGNFSLKKMPLRISISKAIPNLIADVLKVQVCLPSVKSCCIDGLAKIIRIKSCASPIALCPIKEIKAVATGCSTNGKFSLEVNAAFNEQLLTSDKIFVKVAGKTYGPYKPGNFPIKLDPIGFVINGTVPPKVQVCAESILDTCCQEITPIINTTDCNCKLNITVTPVECNDTKYYASIKAESSNGSKAGYVVVGPDGKKYGPFTYDQKSTVIGPFIRATTSPKQTFYAADVEKLCADTVVLTSIVCSSDTICRLKDLKVTLRNCTPQGGYNLWVTPVFAPITANVPITYLVYIGDKKYGPFKLASSPQIIEDVFVDPNATSFEVKACEEGRSDKCCISVKLPKFKCAVCELGELIIKTAPCNDKGEVYAYLDFKRANLNSDFFVLVQNGKEVKYKYAELPIRLILPSPQKDTIRLEVYDSNNRACSSKGYIKPFECKPACALSDISVSEIKCNNDGTYSMLIKLKATNADSILWLQTSTGFETKFKFKGAAVRIDKVPLPKSGRLDWIVVCDKNTTDCCIKWQYELPCVQSPCTFGPLKLEQVCLPTGGYYVSLNFEHANNGIYFNLYSNGKLYGTYAYSLLPLRLSQGAGSDPAVLELKIEDKEKGCTQAGRLELKKCETNCPIDGIKVELLPCEKGLYYAKATVVSRPTSTLLKGYIIYANGMLFGPFNYNGEAQKIGPFPTSITGTIEFLVVDVTNPTCYAATKLEAPKCADPIPCKISNLVIRGLGCNNDGSRRLNINFKYEGVTNRYFDVMVDGKIIGTFPLIRLPLEANFKMATDKEVFKVGVCINDQNGCCEALEVKLPCERPCPDLIVDVKQKPCNAGGAFGAELIFKNPTPGPLRISVNGKILDTLETGKTSFTINSLLGDGVTLYKVELLNLKDTTCKRSIIFGPVKCRNMRTTDVWPGDVNQDNSANHFDLLHIGQAFGSKGQSRALPNSWEWKVTPAVDWSEIFFDGINYKHADVNGDGEVNRKDIDALLFNFGLSRGAYISPKALPATDLDPKILLELPKKGELADSTHLDIPIILGNEKQVIKNIYGVAFSVKFDPKLIDPNGLTVEFPTSWMGQSKVNLESIYKVYPKEGRIDIAITRIDQNEVSGYGTVARIKGIIIDLVGRAETKLKTDDAILNRLDGEILPLNTETTAFTIVDAPRAVRPEDLLSGVTIYPNPTGSQLNISTAAGTVTEVEVMGLDGKTSIKSFRNTNQIELDDLQAGMYFLRIKVGQQFFFERVIKQ
jgi:hypothetical protein